MTLFRNVIEYKRFEGSWCLHLQGEGNMVIRNAGFSHHYTVSQSRIWRSE